MMVVEEGFCLRCLVVFVVGRVANFQPVVVRNYFVAVDVAASRHSHLLSLCRSCGKHIRLLIPPHASLQESLCARTPLFLRILCPEL
jgi:hypothetical protein